MKHFFNKTGSFSLALIVLLSSFSFIINKHICGGEVANVTFFINADNCGMEMQVCKNDTSKQETSFQKEPCCKDVSELIRGNENNQQAKEFKLNAKKIEFLTLFPYLFINKFKETTSISKYVTYKPPLVFKNIQSLFQVVRI